MISVRRAFSRHHERRRAQHAWLSFDPAQPDDPLAHGFGRLECFNEERLGPGGRVTRPAHDAEVLTYACEGTLACEDSLGRASLLHAGEFQRMTVTQGLRHSLSNASRSDDAHAFQLWLRPAPTSLEAGVQLKRFSSAQRRGGLCLIASQDAARGSLRLLQDTRVYSSLLERGHHLVHELAPGRTAWLHVVSGGVALDDLVLQAGDAAAVVGERCVSFTATIASELVLVDLSPDQALQLAA
jgi:redox-sensitive bicupin YhaK (pirin superfamily)